MVKTNTNWVKMTDIAIISQIGSFIKHTRLNKNITQAQLAKTSGLNRWTIGQIENGESVTLSSLIQLLRALDVLYVLNNFEVNKEISPLAYAKLKKEQRERASGKASNMVNEDDDLGW